MTRPLVALAVLVFAIAGACASAYPTAPQATPSPISSPGLLTPAPASPTPALTSPPPSASSTPTGPSAEIEIDISGGPYAGSYRAVAQPGCDSKPAQNRFTVTYADDLAPTGFVALHLVLRDAALALQDESDNFLAEISLSGAGEGISYTIDPLNGAGSGSAFLETSPFDATLDLSADAPDGALVDLSVMCSFP